ncbi:Tripeptidyl-peptidase sed2 [Emmonsiellopsis sp. PD_33]|nr:Tripeptidyl-peptidase sed2 [Emmonsiellopsis sp. PD_33]
MFTSLKTLGTSFLLLLAAAQCTSAADFHIVEKLNLVPQGWTQGPAADKSAVIEFRLAVYQEKEAQFHQNVLEISTPGHPRYGKHMKRDEIKDFLRPRSDVSDQLLTWLTTEGISRDNIKDDGAWISFTASVDQAEKLLNTQFYNFIDDETQKSRIRTLEYSVPEDIAPLVHMIQPTTLFGKIRPQRSLIFDPVAFPEGAEASALDEEEVDCTKVNTPSCLRTLYNFKDFKTPEGVANKIGVSGYLEQYAQYEELETFLAKYAPDVAGANFSVASIKGGLNTQDPVEDSIEANLDIQYVVGLSHTANVTYYTTPGRGELIPDLDQPNATSNANEPYLDQLHYLLDLPDEDLPTVLTTSYGENEQSIPEKYTTAACDLFAQLGARGVSVIFSSGDTGVGSACQSNDGKNTTKFNPIFPAACPFVTSVGGTTGINPEAAVYFSSGGFSERFPRPEYQNKAVDGYLEQLGDRWDGLYNPKGRAFPDVAAQGVKYLVFDKGEQVSVGGTSASAPTIAAIISNLNAIRISKKQPPLGFLNPWIYSNEGAFTDIVNGGSTGCTGKDQYSGLPTPFIPYASWNATKGWDPVTGVGTPDFAKLVDALPKGKGHHYGKDN